MIGSKGRIFPSSFFTPHCRCTAINWIHLAYTTTLQTTCLVLWPWNPSLYHQHVAIINWHGLEGGKVAHLFLTAKGATQDTYLFLLPLGLGAGVLSIHMTYVLMPMWALVLLETNLTHWKLDYHAAFGGFFDLKRLYCFVWCHKVSCRQIYWNENVVFCVYVSCTGFPTVFL